MDLSAQVMDLFSKPEADNGCMPLDQSAAYMLGLFQKKNRKFCQMKKIWGEQKMQQKLHQMLVHFFGPIFAIKLAIWLYL